MDNMLSIIIISITLLALVPFEIHGGSSMSSLGDSKLHQIFDTLFQENGQPRDPDTIINILKFVGQSDRFDYGQKNKASRLLRLTDDFLGCGRRSLRDFLSTLEDYKSYKVLERFLQISSQNRVIKCINQLKSDLDKSLKNKTVNQNLELIRKYFIDLLPSNNTITRINVPLYYMLTTEKLQDSLVFYILDEVKNRSLNNIDMELVDDIIGILINNTYEIKSRLWEGIECLSILEKIHLESITNAPIETQNSLIDLKIIDSLNNNDQFSNDIHDLLRIEMSNQETTIGTYSRLSLDDSLNEYRKIKQLNENPKSWEYIWLILRSIISNSEWANVEREEIVSELSNVKAVFSLSRRKVAIETLKDIDSTMSVLSNLEQNPGLKYYLDDCRLHLVIRALNLFSAIIPVPETDYTSSDIDVEDLITNCLLKIDKSTHMDSTSDLMLYSLITKDLLYAVLAQVMKRRALYRYERESCLERLRSRALREVDLVENYSLIIPKLQELIKNETIKVDKRIRESLVYAKILLLLREPINYKHLEDLIG